MNTLSYIISHKNIIWKVLLPINYKTKFFETRPLSLSSIYYPFNLFNYGEFSHTYLYNKNKIY